MGLLVKLAASYVWGAVGYAHSAVPVRSGTPGAVLGEGVCSSSGQKANFLRGGGGLHGKIRGGAIIA